MSEGQKAQQHIDQQSRPYLPANGIGTVAQEISQLQGLLDLLEKGFNGPAATVKVGDTGRTPLHVVGEEYHLLFNPVNFHQGGDAAHQFWVVGQCADIAQGDDFIAQDATCHWQGMKDFIGHVLLGAGDPEDTALEKIEEMGKVQISLVEDNDLSGANTGAEFTGAFTVVLSRGVNNCEAGKKTVEIEPEMALGGSLAPPVLGPVHAGGDQLNGGGINDMDDAPETPGDSLATVATRKAGLGVCK